MHKKRRFQTYAVGISNAGVITKIYVDDLTHDQLLDTARLFIAEVHDDVLREFIKDIIDYSGAKHEAVG